MSDFDLTADVLAKWRAHASTDPPGYLAGAHVVRLLDRLDALEAQLQTARDVIDIYKGERDEARAEVERLRAQGIPAKVCGASFDPIDASHPIEWLRGRTTVELAFEDLPVPTKIGADWLVVLADTEEADDA